MISRKFSLIELLIVISVISILVALLLPALNSAKGKARSIACTTKMKQIGIGCASYVNDYDGCYLSAGPTVLASATGYLVNQNKWYVLGTRYGYFGKAIPNFYYYDIYKTNSQGNRHLWCPEMPKGTCEIPRYTPSVFTYTWNTVKRKITQITRPSKTIHIGEKDVFDVKDLSWSPTSSRAIPGTIHQGQSNILFFGGNVSLFRQSMVIGSSENRFIKWIP